MNARNLKQLYLDLAVTVKHALLHDMCNACQRADDFGTQNKILMYKFAKLAWYNNPDVEEAQCQLFCKHTPKSDYLTHCHYSYTFIVLLCV